MFHFDKNSISENDSDNNNDKSINGEDYNQWVSLQEEKFKTIAVTRAISNSPSSRQKNTHKSALCLS